MLDKFDARQQALLHHLYRHHSVGKGRLDLALQRQLVDADRFEVPLQHCRQLVVDLQQLMFEGLDAACVVIGNLDRPRPSDTIHLGLSAQVAHQLRQVQESH